MRHSATRCKDLEAWLAQMHSLLTSRDGHTVPPDEKAIEALISEHDVILLTASTFLYELNISFFVSVVNFIFVN